MSITLTLSRDGTHVPWGFKLRGGKDLNEPFIIKQVTVVPSS